MTTDRTNWAGSFSYDARRVHAPRSEDELREIVAASTRVRALGSRHSFSQVANTDGDLVSLADLPRTVSVDAAGSTVTVAAGMRYGEVCRELHEHGFAMHNLGSLPHISMAGAVATATHGSGDGNASLASAVSALEMVTADGELVTVDRDADAERFGGMVVALGALGIVVRMTLDVVPTFEVRQDVYEGLALDTFEKNADEIFAGAYSVSLFTDFVAPTMTAWLKSRVDDVDPAGPDPDWMGARRAASAHHPVPGMSAESCTGQLGVPGPWYDRLPHFRLDFTPSNGAELQSEYLVPRAAAADALRALHGIGEHIAPVLQICELRTVAADEQWLSPAYRQDVVAFHFTWVRDAAAVMPVLKLMEQQLAPYYARPHWGKLFTHEPGHLRSLFPRLSDFRALRHELDPRGTFGNAFVDQHIG
ncbi:xylitol oxidase [Haloactinopolyspora alba]|uniref:Xylitol oxidase n=1 Tax=Haloactinopolyspora alba TaxID=648780 RepID=A0A2P8DVR5_9ACTN|nr:FAD-binding protein [Haloactinopolyspora alba]PSL01291.1 xylitol oxidase [Haloactinopolyspora alba]